MDPESGAESLNKKPTTTSIPARGLEPITGNNDKNVFVPASKLNSAGEKAVKTADFVKPQKGTPPPPKNKSSPGSVARQMLMSKKSKKSSLKYRVADDNFTNPGSNLNAVEKVIRRGAGLRLTKPTPVATKLPAHLRRIRKGTSSGVQ